MEQHLRCNNLRCRKELCERALVTTCSHIYCLDCAKGCGLTSQDLQPSRTCPACRSQLPNPDDVVISNLHPTEDYKTSVLSGLSPNIIMECSGKALSFWAYQMTQEIVYQEYLGKTLSERYSTVSLDLKQVVNEANSHIANLENKLAGLTIDMDKMRHKNEEVGQALREKNKKLMQTQELYDKLKRKAMIGEMQDAASDAVNSNLEAAAAAVVMHSDHLTQPGLYEPQLTSPRHNPLITERTERMFGTSNSVRGHPRHQNPDAGWAKPQGQHLDIPLTPSTHRQRVGNAASLGLSTVPGLVAGTRLPTPSSARDIRQPAPSSHYSGFHNPPSFPGVGLSSGLKTGHGMVHQGADSQGRFHARPRVIHRPTPIQPHQSFMQQQNPQGRDGLG
ncbi:hypothetical protein QBC33DRAFT_540151 [Phialemonium atrogriseum]|uniref:RING-type domain-containing protein n=1 Tax=Phialemonium atrogriseum TaxID=1093897 RepID=A0AAJ0FGM5_9PEZI|nr:uncharacterized protein QBC33DRAFT_540151 [Phialemonium atrogriseum]KAK1766767.1 hypothetical protein QBC33DRAFT_540151 [Phialemonium atrogriseum]